MKWFWRILSNSLPKVIKSVKNKDKLMQALRLILLQLQVLSPESIDEVVKMVDQSKAICDDILKQKA